MPDTHRTTWNFLENTYWYVNYPDLPALQFSADDDLLAWKCDQTVWHISGYKNGYFWGVSSAIVTDQDDSERRAGTPQPRSLVGTVTADGQVQITFTRSRRSGDDSIVTGFGRMSRISDQWVFQMQMTTASSGTQTFHWANMMQTNEGDPSWDNLPGVNLSVPTMLEDASYPQFGDA